MIVSTERSSMLMSGDSTYLPSEAELKEVFYRKYGTPAATGWSPRRRWDFGYFLPADIYEATVSKLVWPGISWLDVGGGHDLFPENPQLADDLRSRAGQIVGVDPSENIHRNPYLHERAQCLIEDFQTDRQFDLATLRMVVEHVSEPKKVADALFRLLKPGGLLVILTVNQWSPVSLLSRFTPFSLHHPIKHFFWSGEEEDTFPVQYKMNTHSKLRRTLEGSGFRELAFSHLEHLAIFGNFRWLNYVELMVWKGFEKIRWIYPENCLLGVYQKPA